jgi:hypothetical protein
MLTKSKLRGFLDAQIDRTAMKCSRTTNPKWRLLCHQTQILS